MVDDELAHRRQALLRSPGAAWTMGHTTTSTFSIVVDFKTMFLVSPLSTAMPRGFCIRVRNIPHVHVAGRNIASVEM